MTFLKSADLERFLGEASKTRTVYVPVDVEPKKSAYRRWTPGTAVSKGLKTARSAKDFFFPQTENLVGFRIENGKIRILDPREEQEDFAVFGVRACDARSFGILDKVFLAEPVDTYYQNRRAHGLILTMTCRRPAETCFCTAFGIDPASPGGDVVFTETADGWYVEAVTDAGREFLAPMADLFEDRDESGREAAKEETRAIMEKLPLAGLSTDAFGGGRTKALFDRPEWASLSEACIGCGTCTFVCPTCQCYDIRDCDTGREIRRFRCWDSCMYSDFTKMAGGNPRLTQKERFRQRFMHKLVYFPENNEGEFGCVGCGRCLRSCPIHMNIVKVMKKLGEDGHEQ